MFFRKVLSVAALGALAGCGSVAVSSPGSTTSAVTSAPETTAVPSSSAASTSSTLPPVAGLRRVHDPGQVTGTITGTCHVRGQLPDPGCTPGAIDPAVTQADIGTTICVSGYTKTVRPPEAQTEAFKFHVAYPVYGIPAGGKTELDHLVSLELGGANDASNLWPETPPTPNPKDSVENALHAAVCAHKVTLAAAQLAIAGNWITAEKVLGLALSSPASAHRAAPRPTHTYAAPVPASCHPVAGSGNCYRPGEFCPKADRGMSGTDAAGAVIVCRDVNGRWRWES
jgi:hypothetical protein